MTRLRHQDGSALVAAVMLMTLMTGIALAAYALVDTETRLSAGERTRETSFNLTEQLLNAQVYVLSRRWPGSAGQQYPTSCATGADPRCPDGSALIARFGGADLAAGATWSTMVRDNVSPNANYYDDALTTQSPCPGQTTGPCTWDADRDGKVWVRAQATVRGKRRTLVALVRIETQLEELPKGPIIAGKFGTTNRGRKVIVDTRTGGTGETGPVHVRCLTRTADCLDYEFDKGQVSPDTTQVGYKGGNALSAEQIDRLRERAIAEGTYHTTCPPNPSGPLVFVEQGDCSYNNSAGPCCNSQSSPGVLVINNGTLSLDGNIVFYGVVYMPNAQNSSGWVISLNGTTTIRGAASIDGKGGLMAGSSAVNIVYDVNVFNKVTSYPNAGIVQNTWREISAAAP